MESTIHPKSNGRSVDIKEFSCPLCTRLLYEPVVLSKCQHTYCQSCISTIKDMECPICSKIFDKSDVKTVQVTLRNILSTYFLEEYNQRMRDDNDMGVVKKVALDGKRIKNAEYTTVDMGNVSSDEEDDSMDERDMMETIKVSKKRYSIWAILILFYMSCFINILLCVLVTIGFAMIMDGKIAKEFMFVLYVTIIWKLAVSLGIDFIKGAKIHKLLRWNQYNTLRRPTPMKESKD